MRKYWEPVVEVIDLSAEDVITTSGGENTGIETEIEEGGIDFDMDGFSSSDELTSVD